MFRTALGLAALLSYSPALAAEPPEAEASLLSLCGALGETPKECRCYLSEAKRVFSPADVELAGGIAKAFINGEEPEAIAAYLLLSRKITPLHANALYKLGDSHVSRVGKKCGDRKQTVTRETSHQRNLIAKRLEKIGARYGIGQ